MKQTDQRVAIKFTPENSRLKKSSLNSSGTKLRSRKTAEPIGVNEKTRETKCWLCNEALQDSEMVWFCDEFDTYYHDKCKELNPPSAHYDCPVCAIEMDEMVISFKTDLEAFQ